MAGSAGEKTIGSASACEALRDPAVALTAAFGAAIFLAWAGIIASYGPFPSQFDELQHISFIRSMIEAPAFFPDYGQLPTLARDLSGWTQEPNYLAHPPLYYVLMAFLPFDVATLRWANLLLAYAGAAMALIGGLRLLETRTRRIVFAALIFIFPRTITTAGMINNDNLVVFETGLIMLLLAAARPRPVAIAFVLALVGWTKLNAFVGLTALVGFVHVQDIASGKARLFGRESFALMAGVLVGFAPVVANLVKLGAPVYVPVDFLAVPPSQRRHLDFLDFASLFTHWLGRKFPPMENSVDFTVPLFVAFLVACLALWRRKISRRERVLATAALGALVVFYGIHLYYGWRSFLALGSLSDAQARYYNMLWPGFAFAFAIGADRLLTYCRSALRKADSNDAKTPIEQKPAHGQPF